MVAAAVVGSAVVGGVMQSKAAGDAADAQTAAANQANATQRYQYDTTRADNAPFLQTGTAANQRLSYLLGLSSNNGAPSGTSNALAGAKLVDTSSGVPSPNQSLYASNADYRAAWDQAVSDHQGAFGRGYDQSSDANKINEYLTGALSSKMQDATTQNQAAAQTDPAYGSLLNKFTQNDLNNDVVYQNGLQFGLQEGEKGINNQAAATGSYLSGATLKALTKYGNDYGTTKANDAYNRFNNDKQSTFNMLSGISGTGQVASNAVGSAGQNYANQVSNNQTALGNARGASAIAGANGVTNALSSGVNGLQTNNLINSLGNRQALGSGYGSSFGTSGLDGSLNDYPTYVS